ncbi:MAG: hypothetical protein LBQ73_10780, partial [Tannerellaceae bacterium]|nr:hypothetical protein [Tannerellaceae bacterium]
MKIPYYKTVLLSCLAVCFSCKTQEKNDGAKLNISGIYPHLAYYNNEGECGTGAVVPWAGSLWCMTYGPHLPFGSSDKLYRISPDMEQTVCEESIGGTPANRMIHRESAQLFIGPYAIDSAGRIRTLPYTLMPGRHTANARHLTDPAGKIYYATMEEGFYEVDVHTLEVKTLYPDGNLLRREGDMEQYSALLPGAHGKGSYSGQGVLLYSNNGEATQEALEKFNVESGSLTEWDGENWTLVRRNQFVEITGPGGIYGNENPATDPVWTTGWDYKSVLLGVRDRGEWTFFRLPKASYSYDGAHGWNTEWPRIRDIGTPGRPDYLMTMHGMFWHFPETFTASNTAGIRPLSAYLKVIGDFTRWGNRLVFGCDDAAHAEFLNKRKAKGGIEGPGQSNSNLWFTPVEQPGKLGPNNASGHLWLNETLPAGSVSEPFLFAGWDRRSAWIENAGEQSVDFLFETDSRGTGRWTALKTISLAPEESALVAFTGSEQGEWIRVSINKATTATVSFVYGAKDKRSVRPDAIFDGISALEDESSTGGLLYGLAGNRRALGFLSCTESEETGYYEIDEHMHIVPKDDPETAAFIREKFAIPSQAVEIDKGSVLIVDDAGRRWRLPLGDDRYTEAVRKASLRICREVATERDLFSCHGTFYELPAENADGYAKIRPVSSHKLKINDYTSYRGLLIFSGINTDRAGDNPHIFISADRKAAVWAGVIDDLWKLGKPVGKGGPWIDSSVSAGIPSDPYLIGFYDQRSLTLSHRSATPVTFTIEADPTGDGHWIKYIQLTVEPGEKRVYQFPDSFLSRWLRLV